MPRREPAEMPADGAIAALRMGPRHVPLATPQGMATRASLKAKHLQDPLYNAATDFTPVVLIT